MKKIIFIILIILSVFSLNQCSFNYETQKLNLIEYIHDIKPIIESNRLKGIESLNLVEEQKVYYNGRTDYFISLLQNDNEKYKIFLDLQEDYYKKFPDNLKSYFYWSRDIFDLNLMMKIEEKFGKIELHYQLLNTFYQGNIVGNKL